MIAHITQEYIDRDERGSFDKCPVALALIEMGYKEVHVGDYNGFIFELPGTEYMTDSIDFPKKVKEFIKDFDWGISVSPISFRIKKPK